MIKTTMKIDGMSCGMCEAHINDAVRGVFKVKKVESSHSKGTTQIISEAPLDDEELKAVIEQTGYTVLQIDSEPYEKKHFSLFKK